MRLLTENYTIENTDYGLLMTPKNEDHPMMKFYKYGDSMDTNVIDTVYTVIEDDFQFEAMELHYLGKETKTYYEIDLYMKKIINQCKIALKITDRNGEVYSISDYIERYANDELLNEK